MTKKEYEEMVALLEQSGLNVKLCDTPVPYFPAVCLRDSLRHRKTMTGSR